MKKKQAQRIFDALAGRRTYTFRELRAMPYESFAKLVYANKPGLGNFYVDPKRKFSDTIELIEAD